MIVVRGVFQAKYGKGDELVRLFKEAATIWPMGRNHRLMTDLSGTFFTVVSESEYESIQAWQEDGKVWGSDPRSAEWFQRMTAVVEGGHRDFFTLVE